MRSKAKTKARRERVRSLVCRQCETTFEEDSRQWRCHCGAPLSLKQKPPPTFPKTKISRRSPSFWRYWEALPLDKEEDAVSVGEGCTPLIETSYKGGAVMLKLEYLLPTHSFKDRGSAVMISRLKELGVKGVVEDSSGNAGASVACYCARAGMKCEIVAPASASREKLLQIQVYGARLVRIEGDREMVQQHAMKQSSLYYAGHIWNPYFLEGTKTVAFEIWEQLGWSTPQNVIVPVGSGTLLLGLYIGFKELFAAREIHSIPRLFAVQADNFAPLYQMYIHSLERRKEGEMNTIAEGIKVVRPARAHEIIQAVRETQGTILTVSDVEIWESLRELGKKGFFVEPTAAVGMAGYSKLMRIKKIPTDELTVVPLTGSGLKAADTVRGMVPLD